MSEVLNAEALGPKASTVRTYMLNNLVGQEEAIDEVVKFYQQQQVGLCYPNRPLANILELGPTGTGKTRMVEVFAEAIYGTSDAVIKVDCGEFQHSHEIAKLIGSPPGYLGHASTPPLITQVRLQERFTDQNRVAIVLFDEIEKACDAVMRLLLGVLDKAKLTTGDNQTIDFSRAMIFMTSNLGTAELYKNPWGFEQSGPLSQRAFADAKKTGLEAVHKRFTPEFVNRLDSILVFKPFTAKMINDVLEMELRNIQTAFIKAKGPMKHFVFEFTAGAKDQILKASYDLKKNARNLKREINKVFLQKIANLLATNSINEGDSLVIDFVDGRYEYRREGANLTIDEMVSFVNTTYETDLALQKAA